VEKRGRAWKGWIRRGKSKLEEEKRRKEEE
jgi:hypothetical protein